MSQWPALALALALAASGAASAEERGPAQRQTLVDLAYLLGQSHALRQVCEGGDDQFWRGRMSQLIATEQPDPAFDRRLRESFNTGFVAGQSAHPACTSDSRREEARAAARGRALAQSLAR